MGAWPPGVTGMGVWGVYGLFRGGGSTILGSSYPLCGYGWHFASWPVWGVCRMGPGSLGRGCGGLGKGLSRAQAGIMADVCSLFIFRSRVCRVNGCK